MSDQQRLRDKLAKLQLGDGGNDAAGRKLDAADKDGLLSAVLQEIDETVLGRLLTLENAKGMTIGMEVANRRILRFIQLAPEGSSTADAVMVDEAIDAIDGPEAVTFLAVLVDLIGEETSLLVRSTKMNRTVDPTEIGCSPDALAKLWMLGGLYRSEQDADDEKRAGFIKYCKEVSSCWAHKGTDEKVQQSDKGEEPDALLPLIEADFPNVKAALHTAQTNCVIFGDAETEKTLALVVFAKSERFVCRLKSKEYPKTIARWHQSVDEAPL